MKHVYTFSEAQGLGKDQLGGKGAGLAAMTALGLPVPPGFTVTTDACRSYYMHRQTPVNLWQDVQDALQQLEHQTGKQFGNPERPLLLSVRSGARFSMPGMMDTILNLGLTDEVVAGLATLTGDARFAQDAYRRLIQMFGDVVVGIPRHHFETALEDLKASREVHSDLGLTAEDLTELVATYKRIFKRHAGFEFPQSPQFQLQEAILAVFKSWGNRRAATYRKLHHIPDDLGTAANVQVMVFGNLGETSGTGVGFTRNPNSGQKEIFGEFLLNAQGEDVVAGIRTPLPLSDLKKHLPEVYEQLMTTAQLLEDHFRDMQDFEFTIEDGKLYMLQTRAGKRSARAAFRIARDLVQEGRITREEAVTRIELDALEQLLYPQPVPGHGKTPLLKALPASPGAAVGVVVFSADEAVEVAKEQPCILVTLETSPEDIHGMASAQGILTARGGMTSHAAVVARGMGCPAVVGADELRVDREAGLMKVRGQVIRAGETITLNGSTGEIFLGELPLQEGEVQEEVFELLCWADGIRQLEVRANADTPQDAERARNNGAQGIGLCRTEHMFFSEERIPLVRKMILAPTPQEELEALRDLQDLQRLDFEGILLAMDGLPVTVRLMDPPLHEFLPQLPELLVRVTQLSQQERSETEELEFQESSQLLERVRELHEVNPMMGLRGARLGITRPSIICMQVHALARATRDLLSRGKRPRPEIMIPLTGTGEEMAYVRHIVEEVLASHDLHLPIGSMIEVPRACLVGGQLASNADFLSFGTNDLTQMTYGYSRDDAARFLGTYVEKGILQFDPFTRLDEDGVGSLIRLAVQDARRKAPHIKLGVCGEHGGEKHSIAFFHQVGLDYVSCSPFRLLSARLAAAHAALKSWKEEPVLA
ncbi:pyruvate, phosphate dikinase [Deinococcus cellulosilyticus]|uniref:Pyruvate, phosphate dikinase n=1 Tax=Deinococcus cellulosilyticus (strain DSM 18568 / NBRC 106333 / KACC 11606 / 5516J-15) TaxID=1223518 RepID=A0A511NAY8_DEIC1|nr:pyruvate, phosphate dikinase [Deinococcus cellulosilyticus]GEM49952.1 pyruvate, phosphate dikinase [Deinococcus cellulosilyticus NBRC 106333 = KACC 11606]